MTFRPFYAGAIVLTAVLSPRASAQTQRSVPLKIDPRAPAASKRLQPVTLFDSVYHRSRRIWVYTPRDHDPQRTSPYSLIIAFDGAEYRDTMPLPLILDTLRAVGKTPPLVAVLIDDSEGARRIADLGNASKMVEFLARQLLPFVRAHWRVTTDPRRVLVTGSSAGGLAAAFVAIQRPDLFGNVLAQSGAFWRGAEGSSSAPYEWLTGQVARLPKREVRFFLDVGELEDHATIGGAGPNFLAANRRFRDALLAKGYSVAYHEIPAGGHSPAYWMTRLPAGIVALTSGWREP